MHQYVYQLNNQFSKHKNKTNTYSIAISCCQKYHSWMLHLAVAANEEEWSKEAQEY